MAASSSSSSSSCLSSSSAITIATPGKSILKRPPPQQPSLFSRITRFLPTQAPVSQSVSIEESKPLKRAHFILPEIAIVYPISSINPPSTPALKDEKRAIEDKERERRRKVVRGSSGGQEFEEWWSMDKVESFYRECCAGCDEQPDPGIKAALKVKMTISTSFQNLLFYVLCRTHLLPIHVQLTSLVYSLHSLLHRFYPMFFQLSGVCGSWYFANVISTTWYVVHRHHLKRILMTLQILKPMLHALLIPGTLSFLSVASNGRLKAAAFRLIGAYVKKVGFLPDVLKLYHVTFKSGKESAILRSLAKFP